MFAFTGVIQCRVYTSVSFPAANLTAFCSLIPLPAWIQRSPSAPAPTSASSKDDTNCLTVVTLGCISYACSALLKHCTGSNLY